MYGLLTGFRRIALINKAMNTTKTTKEIFEELYQRELTDSEVDNMQFNFYDFFRKLFETGWYQARAPPHLDLLLGTVLHNRLKSKISGIIQTPQPVEAFNLQINFNGSGCEPLKIRPYRSFYILAAPTRFEGRCPTNVSIAFISYLILKLKSNCFQSRFI